MDNKNYITLWDMLMKEFNANHFWSAIELLSLLHIWNDTTNPIRQSFTKTERQNYAQIFHLFEYTCLSLGLDTSAKASSRICTKFDESDELFNGDADIFNTLDNLGQYLRQVLTDEMQSIMLFSIELDKQPLLVSSDLFGIEVTNAFPSAIFDIEEAGKCFTFERWTACVFHLMRVMEVALRVLGNSLQLPINPNPTWDTILKKCDAEIKKPYEQKSIEWKNDESFFSNATAMLYAVKTAWRNPTMHMEKVYTEEQAQDIWNTTKGFIKHLSTKLNE